MNKSFEDQWKDVLNEASQVPPPEIWDRIDEKLDKKKRGVVFLLWKNPMAISGIAAAILLVLGTLFLFNNDAIEKVVSETKKNKKESASSDSSSEEVEQSVIKENVPLTLKENVVINSSKHTNIISAVNVPLASSNLNLGQDETNYAANPTVPEYVAVGAKVGEFQSIEYSTLSPIAFGGFANSFQKHRNKIDIPTDIENELLKSSKSGWMGFLAGNAPFNPNFSTPQFQTQALAAINNSDDPFKSYSDGLSSAPSASFTNTSRTDASSSFKRGNAFSFGFGIGKKLKNRFSIESGVRFTRATASQTSNVYALDSKTGKSENFSVSNYIISDPAKSDVLISVNSTSQYAYNFISVPLLLNYAVLNFGKFHVNAVAGVSNEFLLSGSVINAKNSEELAFKPSNSNFKAYNLAGVGGVRLSYTLTDMLDLNVSGTYQHFITSGIDNATSASFKPSMLGLNLGISVRR